MLAQDEFLLSMSLRQVAVDVAVLASMPLRRVAVGGASRGSSQVSLSEKRARFLVGGPPSPSVVSPSVQGTAGIPSLRG